MVSLESFKKNIGESYLDCFCVKCEQLVTMEEDSDSCYNGEDETWWDNYVCPVCHEVYDKSYGNSDELKRLIAYNEKRLK